MANVEYFLKIAGIPGESQDRTHEDAIEIETWSWGVSKAPSRPGGATKPVFQEIAILKKVDRSSPRLAPGLRRGRASANCSPCGVTRGGAQLLHRLHRA
jgi:type VI secretion system secreted protein Hcp